VTGDSDLVWYVAYGSNLRADRMLAYLVGGGHDRPWGNHRGAADATPPRDDRRATVPHPVHFGGHSTRWDGGCCLCPAEPLPPEALPVVGRAWLITRGQLGDVVAQENSLVTDDVTLPDPFPGPGQVVQVIDGVIDLLIGMDPIDGCPAVTFGSTAPPPPGPPSLAYRQVLAEGMAEMGIAPEEAETHLVDLDRS
jgi:hypothetical protein